MAPRPDPPSRSIRRLANRPAIPRRPPAVGTRLADAAAAGLLTRGNTRPGTRGRQAADAEYRRQQAMAHPELPARERLGHRVAGSRERTASFYTSTDGPRFVRVEGADVSLCDVRRAGTYMGAIGALMRGRYHTPGGVHLTGAAADRHFERRFSRWQAIAGLAVVSDPEAVRALAEQQRATDEDIVFDSGRSRAGRRRR
jgi:hypothetical protein